MPKSKLPSIEEIDQALGVLVKANITPLTTSNILLVNDNYIQLGNEVVLPHEIGNLASECKMIRDTRVWKIMQENIRFEAFKMMSEASTTEGMRPGKWMLHNLNAQQGVIDIILQQAAKIPPPKANVSKAQ